MPLFNVIWKYKNQEEINQDTIQADNLDEAEKKANEKFNSNKRNWIDIILKDKTKGVYEY